MKNFTVCHRCHKAFETLRYVPNIRIVEYIHGYGDETYILCPECQKELEMWLEKGRED